MNGRLYGQHDLDSALGKYRADVEAEIQKNCVIFELTYVDVTRVADLAIRTLFKRPTDLMQVTGVVVAGYGDYDYFPGYHEYQCHGLLLGKFLAKDVDSRNVSLDTPAQIKAFATTDMVNTFQMGFSPDVFGTVREELRKALDSFAETLKGELGHAGPIPNLKNHIETAVKAHTDNWAKAAPGVQQP